MTTGRSLNASTLPYKVGLAVLATAAAAGGLVIGTEWRNNPTPFPHFLRFFLRHPLVGRDKLLKALRPQNGERLLEIGPGIGYYAVPVATSLGEGTLHVQDVQQAMLDHTLQAARTAGVRNIHPTLRDASVIPFDDDYFDGAYLVEVIGEIPDKAAALNELRRVIRPGGRLVVGEDLLSFDVHFMTHSSVTKLARSAGFTLEERFGTSLGYFAVFRA
ncbi:class I SAM-dependent methyltransferase [Nocardia xishanensis]